MECCSVGRRKAILASLLNKIDDHADELSALLTTEQGGALAQARWEIDLLTKAFGPALMQMELHEKEEDVQHIEHITKRYVPIDVVGADQPMEFASYTFIWEGTPSVTGW